ncbi:cytochrome P450 [Streptomyces sp. NPDC051322]|uniref:cytochrome P450 n=1 Tax=Streptomyces sp. NPDC051322 TaxID=3154645 RepID=UPI00344FC1FA
MSFDPFDFETQKDPYPAYEWLRNESPVYYVEKHDLWVLSRYEDVQSTIRDWETYSNREGVDIDKTDSLLSPGNMDEKDGREHDVYRRLLQPWFSPKVFQRRLLEPVRAEVARLVGDLVAQGSGDVTEMIAWQLPTFVVAQMFDVPEERRPEMLSFMKPVFARVPNDPNPPQAAFVAGEHIEAFCREIIVQRRQEDPEGRDDIISHLMRSELEGSSLSDEQILGMIAHLIVASSGTTQDLITNAIWLLADHPGERAKLIEDRSKISAAIEECLRYESVVQSVSRVSNVVTQHHGTNIPAGATIVNLLGSANRDERYWEDPKRFDISRKPGRHLAFADGIHHCIGAPVARLETRLVLEELLTQMPEYELAVPPVRAISHVARGFEHVEIRSGA